MPRIKWDDTGERLYETGASNGVIYPQVEGLYPKGEGWNGLISVEEQPEGAEPTALYANNHKYLNLMSAEEYNATVSAYTYPDAFAKCDGSAELMEGVEIGQQTRKPFGFCYQTLIGNDTESTKHGYKIHIVYGAMASPSEKSHETVSDDPTAEEMSWDITTTPVEVEGFDPTSTMVINSTKFEKEKMETIKNVLYGTDPVGTEGDDDYVAGTDPRLPFPDEIVTILKGTI